MWKFALMFVGGFCLFTYSLYRTIYFAPNDWNLVLLILGGVLFCSSFFFLNYDDPELIREINEDRGLTE